MKDVPFAKRRYTEGVLFREKWCMYIKGKGVAHRGGASPYKHFFREGIPMAATVSTSAMQWLTAYSETCIKRTPSGNAVVSA